MDIISNLPGDICCHIGSFLSAKEAARTMVLSKNWMNRIIITKEVAFVPTFMIKGSFELFVAGVLAGHASFRIKRFSLTLRFIDFDQAQYNLVNDCLRNVLKRGIFHLELDINVKEDYILPFEVFTCESVEKLKLGTGFVIDIIPQNALLPALKTLILGSVRFLGPDVCAFQRLLYACPVLEELVIEGFNCEVWKWPCVMSSQILKKLTIRSVGWVDIDITSFRPLSFDTPNLEYLELCDVLRDVYPVVNLGSLVEAKLDLPLFYDEENYNLTNLIKGLNNVQTLRLVDVETMNRFYDFVEAVPVFENLHHLTITTDPDICWTGPRILLEQSPNIKSLDIEGPLHYHSFYHPHDFGSICECLGGYDILQNIEVLKISEFNGNIEEMNHIKHVLGNLPRLRLLEVRVQTRTNHKKMQIMKNLTNFRRASATCVVNAIFSDDNFHI